MIGEEHWEIAAIADAFEDWASTSYRRGRCRPSKRLRLRTMSIPLAQCDRCGALAEWRYIPADGRCVRCDDCVPRGCGCQIVEEDRHIRGRTVTEQQPDGRVLVWTEYDGPALRQQLDSFGRELPCIEFEFYPGGFPRRIPWMSPDDDVPG